MGNCYPRLLLICGQSGTNLLVAHNRGDFVFHITQRYLMVLLVVRANAVGSQNNLPVSLISINRRHADAGMRVNSSEDKRIGTQPIEHLFQIGSVECAVSFLDDHGIRRRNGELGSDLTALCPFDRDANSFSLHVQKGISEVGLEFLANPDYRMLEVPHEGDELVDRSDELLLWCWSPFLQIVIQHVDHN